MYFVSPPGLPGHRLCGLQGHRLSGSFAVLSCDDVIVTTLYLDDAARIRAYVLNDSRL